MFNIEIFRKRTQSLGYRPKAIFPSEMFIFATQAKHWKIDHIVESGVGYGGSTSYLIKLFPNIKISCVDNDRYRQFDRVKILLKRQTPNIELFKGESVKLLPRIVRKSRAKRIAVLIDGPKRQRAVELANHLKRDRRVRFVAVHDLSPVLAEQGTFTSMAESYDELRAELDSVVGDYRRYYPRGPGLTFFENA